MNSSKGTSLFEKLDMPFHSLYHCNHSGTRTKQYVVKGDGGADGLTQNSEALRRLAVSGSEMPTLITV